MIPCQGVKLWFTTSESRVETEKTGFTDFTGLLFAAAFVGATQKQRQIRTTAAQEKFLCPGENARAARGISEGIPSHLLLEHCGVV